MADRIYFLASKSTLHVRGLPDNGDDLKCDILDRHGDYMAHVTHGGPLSVVNAWQAMTAGPYNAAFEGRRWCQVCVDRLDRAHELTLAQDRAKRRTQLNRKVAVITDADVADLFEFDMDEVRAAAVSSFNDTLHQWGRQDDDYTTMTPPAQRDQNARQEFRAIGDTMRGICLAALRDAGYDL